MTTAAATESSTSGGFVSTEIRLVREYPHPRAKVWRAITDPAIMALWLMRPEGFVPVVGTRFRLVAKPQPGWRGYVDCEVLEVREQQVLRYAWNGDPKRPAMEVSYTLEDVPGGTRLTFLHTGFKGFGGFLLARLMMGPGWKKMFGTTIPAVLADLLDDGTLRPGSTLKPKFGAAQ